MQIEINEPELLNDLCDYLSRHGLVAVAAKLGDIVVYEARRFEKERT